VVGPSRLAFAAVFLAVATATPVSAEGPTRFSVESLVGLESLGSLRVSDDGRWVMVERQGPYNSAATYAYGPLTGALLSDLLVFDTSGRSPDRVIGAEDEDGYLAGPISPDGRRMVVYRLTGRDRRLGVMTLEAGTLKWFNVSPQLAVAGRTVAWSDDRTLVVVQTPDNALPLYYRLFRDAQAQVSARWKTAQDGRWTTSTLVASGPARDSRPQISPSRLLRLDTESGEMRTLLSGEIFDFELSPDEQTLAVLLNGEDVQTDPATPLTVGTPTRRRRLTLVDLATGRAQDPAPALDVLAYLLAWSADGRRLLVYGRDDGALWEEGRFAVVTPEGEVTVLNAGLPAVLHPAADPGAVVAQGRWPGDDPVLWLESAIGPAWMQVRGNSTIPASDIPETGTSATPEGRKISATTALDGGERSLFNPGAENGNVSAVLTPQGCVRKTGADGEAGFCPEPVFAGQTLTIASANARTAVFFGRDGDGVGHVSVAMAEGGTRTLATLNPALAGLNLGTIREIPPPDGSTTEAPSWLLLPPGPAPSRGWPLVVRLYPGSVYPQTPAILRPGVLLTQLNPPVLADAGYAVLVPSLAQDAGQADLSGLADRLGVLVDRAVASGDIDASHVALMGHSYGGHAALLAATESNRFQAVVASAGLSDMATSLRDTVHSSANPADGVWISGAAGWLETGQGGLGKLPWADPAAYVAASPIYTADRIRTPVLIIQGDQDPVSAEAMFGALYRLNRDAALLTYWGEGHNLASPANIVDLHQRVIQFLDDHLKRAPAAAGMSVAAAVTPDRNSP